MTIKQVLEKNKIAIRIRAGEDMLPNNQAHFYKDVVDTTDGIRIYSQSNDIPDSPPVFAKSVSSLDDLPEEWMDDDSWEPFHEQEPEVES